MVYPLHLCFQLSAILGGHILQDEEGEGPLVKAVQQLVLADDGVHVPGQIVEHIVVDPCGRHAKRRGDHQQQGQDQDGDAALDHRFGEFHTAYVLSVTVGYKSSTS